MKTNKILLSLIFLTVGFLIALPVVARIGVGVNLGKIEIDEPLKPGGIYNFPIIGVINTGDEAGDYEVEVTYHQDQPQLRPAQEWFSFEPQQFNLEPGQSQSVAIKLTLPVKTKPGDYFAYLEAHPIIKAGPGTTIGVAAATKTYFSVVPANLLQAVIWRVSSFFTMYAPWTYVVLSIIAGAIIITIFRKFFAFQIGIRRK
ncbi:MAG TPA: hypothetical protein ENI19_03280 [Candidatus Nealsonbacteria bacterium]|uniref:Alpha-galactosidase NEW3 domain-containing protein n=1 Tax=marine sediment metagenome TaxID=412755 RepID=A0A0F9VRZ3_9ZZZZ|nr:hypothetical protein [Candidatus Nealsonbacteria bacterium]HEB46702.1 hypothetical protein [Candidatus Nealsonbacteria bacterium]